MSPSVHFKLATVLFAISASGCASSFPGFYGPEAPLAHDSDTLPNGQPYATAGSALADLEADGPIQVRVVRSYVDHNTGITRLLVSDEFLTLSPGDVSDWLPNVAISIDGQTLVFADYETTGPKGQLWGVYLLGLGEVSGAGGVFSYTDGQNAAPFDTEAFFAFGLQTDPAEIVALSGSAGYIGNFEGWGQVLDPGSNTVLLTEEKVSGAIALIANFDSGTVDGGLDGLLAVDDREFTVLFSAPISGNGYSTPIQTFDCVNATCVSRSEIAGVFYGADALETSGIIGLDVTVRPDDGVPYRFVSGAGFTAVQ